MKEVEFRGSSLDDLRAFPSPARREAGFQIDRLQNGLAPLDWKPFNSVGPGVNEIRVSDTDGTYRVLYVAKFQEAVYVLHCFEKRTQKTPDTEIAIAKKRYAALVNERRALVKKTKRPQRSEDER